MRCMICYQETEQNKCPRCGYTRIALIGDSEEAQKGLQGLLSQRRSSFLRRYDIGIQTYSWKEQDEEIVLDRVERCSLGTADRLREGTVWLDREFARIEEEEMTVELSVIKDKEPPVLIPVQLKVPQEKQLQTIGVELNEELQARVSIRNASSRRDSDYVDFL